MPRAKRKNQTVAVLGYGSQGHAIALNLRDSGYDVTIGLKSRSKSRKRARKDRFSGIETVARAVSHANIIVMALPDHLHGRIFKTDIKPHLAANSTLVFLHGLSVHFGFIVPPKDCDVVLLAPHAPGIAVREKYRNERDLSAFYAVAQNHSGHALRTVRELAEAIGFARRRLVRTSFRDEAVGDLFGEQAVLCGGMAELILAGFDTLVKNGIPEENAYLEVAYQLDLIIDLIKKYGIEGMYERISVAARYGSILNGPKVIDRAVRSRMKQVLKEIESGKFPARLNRLTEEDVRRLTERIKKDTPSAFDKAAKKYAK